ncbi:MAG: TolB family protein, partial [Phycisphaerae bacterium]
MSAVFGAEEHMSDQRTKKDRMPRRKLIIVTAIALAGFSLIALAASRPYWPVGHTVMTDSDRIERPESGAHIREVLWTPPVRMPDAFNTTGEDYEPKVSHDGSTLFFVRGKAGHNADIYMAGRDGLGWGEPVPVAGINSEYDDLGACLSRDGTALYFYSNRPGGFGGYDIWVAHRLLGRSDDAESPQFGEPVNLGPSVNSSLNDYGPSLTPDDRYLYFASNRPEEKADMPNPDAWQATVREDLYKNDYDLFTVLLTESGPQPAERAVLLNSEDDEGAPAISPVGDFLYFASNRDGGLGGFDLYRSRLIDGKPTSVTNLGDDVNTRHDELDPTLNMGGFGLFFSSNRVMLDAAPQVEQIASSIAKPEADRDSDSVINENGDSALQNLNEDQGAYQQEAKPPAQDDVQVSSESASKLDFDLFHTKSREVFRRVDYGRASFDWLGFWNDVGRWLLLALLALLLILLLLYLLQSVQGREMSLLARCLIASLLAHVVLMFLLALWQVTAGIPNGSNEGKGIIVSLAARDVSGGLAAQVTSKLTQVDMPSPVERQVEKSQAELSRPLESTMLAFEAPVATRATTLESAMPPPPPMEASQVPVSRTSAVPSIRVAEQPSQSVNAGATRLRLPETVMPSNQADPQPVTVNATLASDTTYERENVNAAPWQSTPLSETTLDHSRLAQATDADSLRRVQFDAPTLTDRAGRQSQQFAMPDMLAMQTDPTSEAALPDTAVSMPSADPRGESA